MFDIFGKFNSLVFLFLTLSSLIVYFIFQRKKDGIELLLLRFSLILFFLYSAFGASFNHTPLFYSFMYVIFLFVFYGSFYFIQMLKFPKIKESSLNHFVKYGNFYIITYLFISLLNSAYPSFNFIRLFIPRAPQINLESTFTFKGDLIQSIFFYSILFLQPFYFVSLFRFRFTPLKLFIFLFLPLYFSYSLGGYVARSSLLPFLIIFVYSIYYFNPALRKRIKLFVILSTLPLILFSFLYSEWRLGHDTQGIDILEGISFLLYQEFSFPSHYITLSSLNVSTRIVDFFYWLFLLPIPGFIKGGINTFEVNIYFTELITGTSKFSSNFFVYLPGVITESFLIFGNKLFFILPIIGGVISGLLYKSFKLSRQFFILRVYFIFMFIPLIARAGFFSAIPVAVNGFFFFFIFLIFQKYRFE